MLKKLKSEILANGKGHPEILVAPSSFAGVTQLNISTQFSNIQISPNSIDPARIWNSPPTSFC
jgi:hypothetical protein